MQSIGKEGSTDAVRSYPTNEGSMDPEVRIETCPMCRGHGDGCKVCNETGFLLRRVKHQVRIRRIKKTPSKARTYVISSITLCQIFEDLMVRGSDNDEELSYCAGIVDRNRLEIHPTVVLRTVTAVRSAVFCQANGRSVLDVFRTTDEYGLPIVLLSHLHPGELLQPSGRDLKTQIAYEKAGYNILGAIFVRSGKVRFYSAEMPFKVMIYGKGISKLGDDRWQITVHPNERARLKEVLI